jgi:hypothetical protein
MLPLNHVSAPRATWAGGPFQVRGGKGHGIEVAGRIRFFSGENLSMLPHLADFTGTARAFRAIPVK